MFFNCFRYTKDFIFYCIVAKILFLKDYYKLTFISLEVKHYPMSIYFYDSRDVEQELHNQSRKSEKLLDLKKIPKWVEKIYQNYKPHTGEAPIFCGQFLPSNKVSV